MAIQLLFYRLLFPKFVQNSTQFFYPYMSLESKWCKNTVVLTRVELGRILVSFYIPIYRVRQRQKKRVRVCLHKSIDTDDAVFTKTELNNE